MQHQREAIRLVGEIFRLLSRLALILSSPDSVRLIRRARRLNQRKRPVHFVVLQGGKGSEDFPLAISEHPPEGEA